jgi:hypothetical protein
MEIKNANKGNPPDLYTPVDFFVLGTIKLK